MNTIATSARMVRAPLRAAARRQYSTAPSNGTPKFRLTGTQKVIIGTALVLGGGAEGVFYYQMFKKDKKTE
ncbi:hypothetical protein BGZ75_008372 [Mortierella antarctica]|nr:hypothetical protein BGZ67_000376 [Mortierella alpina]KAF9988856.1 hypothetical protein BGZ75_008372 [Mortierella antarctica]